MGRQSNQQNSFGRSLYSPKKIAPASITIDLYDTTNLDKNKLQQGSFCSKLFVDRMTGDPRSTIYQNKKTKNLKKVEENKRLTAFALMDQKADIKDF